MKNRIVPACIMVAAFLLIITIPRISSAEDVTIDPATATYWLYDGGRHYPYLGILSSGVQYWAVSDPSYVTFATEGTIRAWFATLMLAEARGKTVQIQYEFDGVCCNYIYNLYAPK